MIRQANNKRRQAVNKYNSLVRKRNQNLRSNNQKIKNAINDYNRKVRAYNSNQNRLQGAIVTFKSTSRVEVNQTFYQSLHTTTKDLSNSYNRLESEYSSNNYNNQQHFLLDLPNQETTNSVQLFNSLTGNDVDDGQMDSLLTKSPIEEMLYEVNEDLGRRWAGALYSLTPSNPDAARHFCTSSREILVKLLDHYAPDDQLIVWHSCEYTESGEPTRRSKIRYLLDLKSITSSTMEDFVEKDIADVIQLFRALNDGTHGHAGSYEINQLLKLKKRVEDSLMFISSIGII